MKPAPPALTCTACRYNLVGIPPGGVCPECGTLVELSLHGDLLCRSDPEYVARLKRGATLLVYATLLIFAFPIIAIFMTAAMGMVGLEDTAFLLSLAAAAALMGLWSSGWWLLATPDPQRPPTDTGPNLLLRAVAIATALLSIATLIGIAVGFIGRPLPDGLKAGIICSFAAVCYLSMGVGALLIYRLAKSRLRFYDLPRLALVSAVIAVPLPAFLLAVSLVISPGLVFCIMLIPLLAAPIFFLSLVLTLQTALDQELRIARQLHAARQSPQEQSGPIL